jgi:hypothetical protein
MKVTDILGIGRMPPEPQLYGVEIEVENGYNCNWTDDSDWSRVEDGSLRNDGMEFITPPVTMDRLNQMAREYYQEHDDRGYLASIRTGIHVHADMRWRTLEQVGAIVALYCALEPVLFQLCGPEREECIYCVPWYRATDDADLMGDLLEQENSRYVRSHLDIACKYSALYIEPLRRLGTIEFRQAPTFHTARDLMTWAKAIEKLVTLGHYYGTAARVVEVMENKPEQALNFVMKDFDNDMALALMEECDSIGVAQRLVRTRQPSNWKHNMDGELPQSGIYYQHAESGRQRRPAFEIDPFEEVREDYDDEDEYNEDEEY